jgi:hypothetical protein
MKNNKLKVLHVLPTLKKDGAEVQLSELFKKLKILIFIYLLLIYMKKETQ